MAGEELGSTVDFFRPLHVEHLIERCPAVLKYLGLAPGWRFLLAPDYEDVWLDASSLEVKKLDGWKAAELDKDKMTGLTATPFLMFQGNGREALDFYAATFPGATIEDLQLYGPGEPSPEGTVRSAVLIVGGQRLRIFDSPPVHAFSFTPAISFFLDCESEAQLRGLAAALLEGGAAMMPVASYGFSTLFAWVADRFGVSWQLNLA